MPKFLILESPNKGNVGTITHRDDNNYYKPTFYKITDEEIELYAAMNAHAKSAYIAEKLEAQKGKPEEPKKKVAPIVEVVESQVENVSVETPETEVVEPLNEPLNDTFIDTEDGNLKEDDKESILEMEDSTVKEITEPKKRGRKPIEK